MKKRTSLYISPPIAAAIDGVESISGRISAICDRYAEMTRRARVENIFSADELSEICKSCDGVIFDRARNIDGAILSNLEDYFSNDLYGLHVAEKLINLDYSRQVALVEYIESNLRKGV